MKNPNNKQISAFVLTLLLLSSVSALMAILPTASAAVVQIDTNAYVLLSPNPVGVGQMVLVSYRIDKVRIGATDTANHFEGFSVTITNPDGTTETRSNLGVDSTSGSWFTFTPSQVGTYTFQTHFPAQWANGTNAAGPYTYLYKASDSSVVPLTVQADPVQGITDNPLPTDAWRRPINSENKDWNRIADNWLMRTYDIPNRGFCMTNAVAPYTSAPESAHILWAKPIIFGGQAGGKYDDASYYTGLSYEQFYNPLILEGRIIYTEHGPTTTTPFGTRIMDLYTGEEIMYLEGVDIIFAQVLKIDNPNEHGLIAYLWSTSGRSPNAVLNMYDAFTGRQILTVENVTWGGLGGFNGGPTTFGPDGEILSYSFTGTGANMKLVCWNSSKAIYSRGNIDTWSPAFGSKIDGNRGIEYEAPAPNVPGLSISAVHEGYVLAQTRNTTTFPYVQTDVCFDAATGRVLWTKQRTNVYQAFFAQATSIRDGMYLLREEGRMTTLAYSIATGEELWETEPLPNGWGIFEYQRDIAYGKVYTTGYTGVVRAFDATTGNLAWEFDMGSAGYETVYGVWPTYSGFTIADNKMFLSNDEHSPDSVLWRGGKLWAINTNDGTLAWSIAGMMRHPVISDGLLTALNSYDGQVYTFGKGPSKTTVTAPDVAVAVGTGLMIRGSVTDQSPGQPGTPAVSDESMTAWMEYLYMQRPMPNNVKGVNVVLTAVDSSGVSQTIGTTTTDANGNFGFTWTPSTTGQYQIKASFMGTNSYSSSSDSTYVCVSSAPSASPSVVPGPDAAAGTDVYIIAAAAAIIVVVVAVAAVFLRKRK